MVDVITLGGVVIAAVVFGVRQEGRINTQTQRVDDLKELIVQKFDGLAEVTLVSQSALDKRLDRIERTLNGAWKKAGETHESNR